jgi:hypothetical protein
MEAKFSSLESEADVDERYGDLGPMSTYLSSKSCQRKTG